MSTPRAQLDAIHQHARRLADSLEAQAGAANVRGHKALGANKLLFEMHEAHSLGGMIHQFLRENTDGGLEWKD